MVRERGQYQWLAGQAYIDEVMYAADDNGGHLVRQTLCKWDVEQSRAALLFP